jgi:hypothetical protein
MSFQYTDPLSDFKRYLDFLHPAPGDSTYSILKAHLAIEQVFRDYLDKRLPHPEALKDARIGFMQRMHLVRALSNADPKHWAWTAVTKLNSIRNQLAHHLAPKELARLSEEYVTFCITNSGNPLPPAKGNTNSADGTGSERFYTAVDMVTSALFAGLCAMLDMAPTGGPADQLPPDLVELVSPGGVP